jgi:membrane-bound lytic murein transglycosylase MltF
MNTVGPKSSVHRGVVALLLAAITACSDQQKTAPPVTAVTTPSAADAAIPETVFPYDALPESVRLVMDRPFTGDFDAMVKRRAIRVAVTFNRTHYFIDRGQERGLTYESLKLFENDLNADLKTGNLKVHVVIVPMTRKQLYPALASGKVDMVAAMVTVRPELEKLAAFSVPTRTNVNEVVVTGPGAPPIATVDDLAGQEGFVRKGSIYEESLDRLNVQLKASGKPAVVIDQVPDVLEDDDVLEMVNAGLVPITVVDDYLAEFWSKLFTGIKVHSGHTWLRKHPKGDAFRNTIERRYLDNVKVREELDANIHAGVKYMQFMMDQYFKDDPMDNLNKGLMTFAAYNAGPGRLKQLRRETETRGLDPNVRFGNVERVASERIGRETVTYVSNIYKYYIAYGLMSEQRERRAAAKAAVGKRQ